MGFERRYELKWKPRTRIDDNFLADVAHAHQSAWAFGPNPRQAIVEDTAPPTRPLRAGLSVHASVAISRRLIRGRCQPDGSV